MKRAFCIALVILTALSLCPALAEAEAAGTSDESDYTELIQAICDANQLEALFSRHESLQFLFANPAAPDGYDVIWETQDAYYQSLADYYAVLVRDQIYYMLIGQEDGGFSLLAGYDYDQYYHPYTLADSTADEMVDPAHARPIDSHEEDGKLFLTIEYDESLARESLESMSLEYTGQVVMARITADASTREILAYDKFTVEDGEESVFATTKVSYDLQEPMACITLRAAFEREYVKTIDVTHVFDPGTDHEVVKTMTVPANTACDMLCQSVPYVYFYDLEQTRCTGWDRMNDLTVYVYTNPDEALIRHFQELLDAPTDK